MNSLKEYLCVQKYFYINLVSGDNIKAISSKSGKDLNCVSVLNLKNVSFRSIKVVFNICFFIMFKRNGKNDALEFYNLPFLNYLVRKHLENVCVCVCVCVCEPLLFQSLLFSRSVISDSL